MPSNTVSKPTIKFILTKTLRLDDYVGAVEVLVTYGELDKFTAMTTATDVFDGKPTVIEVRGSISRGAVKKIREYFVMEERAQSTAVAPVQLRLWTIKYRVKRSPLTVVALVLSETSVVATESLMKRAAVDEIIEVMEIKGPFPNGHVLTTSMLHLC